MGNMKTILAPVDFSNVTPSVLEFAVVLATKFSSRLLLLHIIEPTPDFTGLETVTTPVYLPVPPDPHRAQMQLDVLAEPLRTQGLHVETKHGYGRTTAMILDEQKVQDAGLIILGSHGHGALYHLLMGSVASGVLKGAACPVVIVPHPRS